jgi:ATP-dependent RNA helicase DDX18/HAS1
VGRTARGRDGKGHALLMLLPEELAFLKYLKAAKVPLNEYDFPTNKIANVQVGGGWIAAQAAQCQPVGAPT